MIDLLVKQNYNSIRSGEAEKHPFRRGEAAISLLRRLCNVSKFTFLTAYIWLDFFSMSYFQSIPKTLYLSMKISEWVLPRQFRITYQTDNGFLSPSKTVFSCLEYRWTSNNTLNNMAKHFYLYFRDDKSSTIEGWRSINIRSNWQADLYLMKKYDFIYWFTEA